MQLQESERQKREAEVFNEKKVENDAPHPGLDKEGRRPNMYP